MNIIVGCEESQAVTVELLRLGHNAFSCDLKPCSGGRPDRHIIADILEVIKGGTFLTEEGTIVHINKWDAGIFFPDCTYLTVSANSWFKDQPARKSGALVGAERRASRERAADFFMTLYNCDINKVAIENPIGVMSSRFSKPNQVVQPWMFGHGETKATCLWLRGFDELKPTNIVEGREQKLHNLSPSKDRATLRSKTYIGVAKAMANQWFEDISLN